MPRLREEIMMHWLHSVIIPCTATQQIVLLPAEVMCDVHTVNDLSLPIWLHNFPRVISGVRQKEQSKCKANTQPPLHCPVYWPGQAEEGGERSKTGVWSPQTITTQLITTDLHHTIQDWRDLDVVGSNLSSVWFESVVCNDTKRLFSLQEYIRKVTALETLYLSIFQPLLRTKDLVEMKNNNSL